MSRKFPLVSFTTTTTSCRSPHGDFSATKTTRRRRGDANFSRSFLDSATLREAHRQGISAAPASTAEAKQLVRDYLQQIYKHVKQTIQLQAGISTARWRDITIEFIFSVPTTWRTLESVNTFKSTVSPGWLREGRPAAFGHDRADRVQAAASVASIKRRNIFFQRGDIFLSVDAGGGTTDFALMQVTEAGDLFSVARTAHASRRRWHRLDTHRSCVSTYGS